MSVGGPDGGHQSNINLTPMIDVLLVLLILFLIIQPALTKGIDLQVPAQETLERGAQAPDQIVLHVRDGADGPAYSLNDVSVPADALAERIREIFESRPRKVLFVEGEESLPYSEVVRAIDVARGSGIEVIGLVPRAQRAAEVPRGDR
jgi:biopolymer transport protein ExbD